MVGTDTYIPIRAMGIDPGFAWSGFVVIEKAHPDIEPRVLSVDLVNTMKQSKKTRSNLRVTNDDVRRHMEIEKAMKDLCLAHSVTAVGVEAYRVYEGKGGNAWKTVAVYGGILYWCKAMGIYAAPFLPSDLKQRFCKRKSASKIAVGKSLCMRIQGLEEELEKIPPRRREHITDAAGHAMLVTEEVEEYRRITGIQ